MRTTPISDHFDQLKRVHSDPFNEYELSSSEHEHVSTHAITVITR